MRGEKVRALALGLILIAIVVFSALQSEQTGLGVWFELRNDLQGARSRVANLTRENAALRREITALEASPDAVERAIREDLGLVRPGEILVRFGGRERHDLPRVSSGGWSQRETR